MTPTKWLATAVLSATVAAVVGVVTYANVRGFSCCAYRQQVIACPAPASSEQEGQVCPLCEPDEK